ncbi:MAG: branched-chain amino acid ABC transporter permease [Chloroflexi bacterium]|nr:branched-chain amino acid ABC transporter permease [Chloroflexota bacterium]
MPGSGHFKTSFPQDMAVFDTPFRRLWLIILLLGLVAFPFFAPRYFIHLGNLVLLASIAALMLNLLTGYTGMISLGHAAFLAAGAFTVAALVINFKPPPPFWLTVPAAGAVGAILGLLASLPALRLRAVYLILSTVSIHYIVTLTVSLYQSNAGFISGINIPTATLGPLKLENSRTWFYFLLVVTVVVTIFSINLVRSRIGRAWMAIRDKDIAAAALGVNVAFYKILAFTFTSSVTAMAGALGAYYLNYAAAEEFTIWLGIFYIAMIIVGGIGSILGSFFGAAIITLMPYLLDGLFQSINVPPRLQTYVFAIQFAAFGLLIALFLLLEPDGLVAIWRKVRTYFEMWPLKYHRPPSSTR